MFVRKSEQRGKANFGWLDSRHTFSFGQYYDPEFMGFGPLRVINEDKVQPGAGFGEHGHRDMEIISYVLDGGLEHKDSLGTGSVIVPGDVQRMTAGTGIRHSEYNHSNQEKVHFLQIWILPKENGLQPSYEQKQFFAPDGDKSFRLIASEDGRDGALTINQDVNLWAGLVDETTDLAVAEGRLGWLQVAHGTLTVNGEVLEAGDGAAFHQPGKIDLSDVKDAEVLFFDMTP